jgi:hypothetical protein
LPKAKSILKKIRKFYKGSGTINLSKRERLELHMKYQNALNESKYCFSAGMAGHFFFSQKPEFLNELYCLTFSIISILLVFCSLIKFLKAIRIREKIEKRNFWE